MQYDACGIYTSILFSKQDKKICWTIESLWNASIISSCGVMLMRWGLNKVADIFKCIFLKENRCIFMQISPKFVYKGPNDYESWLVLVMAWCRTGDKPLPETILTNSPDAIRHHQRHHGIFFYTPRTTKLLLGGGGGGGGIGFTPSASLVVRPSIRLPLTVSAL